MEDIEREHLLKDIGKLIEKSVHESSVRIDKRIDELSKSNSTLSNHLTNFEQELKKTRELADEAKKIADRIKNESAQMAESLKEHNKKLETKINSFAEDIKSIYEQNGAQLKALDDMALVSQERLKKNNETQELVISLSKTFNESFNTINALAASDIARKKREEIAEALQKKDEERVEKFWKRLPIWISIIIVVSGLFIWMVNSLIMQSKLIDQQKQNILQQSHDKTNKDSK
jgi:DNA repair exonuclease SbcCD ATPase subunit